MEIVGAATVPPGVYVVVPELAALTVVVVLPFVRVIVPAGVYDPFALTLPLLNVI